MMNWFRKTQLDPLAVSMSGVKLGDRLLVVGCTDPRLIAALAAKAGLTGRACAVDWVPDRVAHAQRTAEREGALIETSVASRQTLGFEYASFDVVVLRDVLSVTTPEAQRQIAGEALRVLRPGGRCLVVDGSPHRGLAALFRSSAPARPEPGDAVQVLQAGGFAGVRTLAEREGQVFVEGVKRNV
jgi:ubiquinone/menaquinone biosynthesis C-methylase UbiE